MQQEIVGMQSQVSDSSPAVWGLPSRWRAALGRFQQQAEEQAEELVGMLWDHHSGAEISIIDSGGLACFKVDGPWPAGGAALVHSHPAGLEYPSHLDQATQIALGKASVICPRGGEPFGWGGTIQPAPLMGRPFRWGVTDCWGLIRDAMPILFGRSVRNYPREWQFWRDQTPVFEQYIAQEGFKVISDSLTDSEPGDLLLFKIHSQVYNHAGLRVEDGMLHHPSGPKPYDPTIIPRVEYLDRWSNLPVGVLRRA